MNWQAVTFYTSGTGYEREVQRLVASAEACAVPLIAYAYPNRGAWRANLNYKSECVLRAMGEYPGKDIVFIDADAVINAYPTLFDELSERRVGDYDLAAHYLRGVEFLSGTLWIANDERVRQLVKEWHRQGNAHAELRHQVCLQRVVAAYEQNHRVSVYRLPIEYTCIFDHPLRRGKIAVIEHFQASRRYRRHINMSPMRSMGGPFRLASGAAK